MKAKHHIYFAVPMAIGMFFYNKYFSLFAVVAAILYFFHTKGVFRLMRKIFTRWKSAEGQPSAAVEPVVESEPTMITLVARAPNELLGVDQDAGTATIFHSFYKQVKEEQGDNLRLNKQGRRLTAAKNEMLYRRRKQGRPDNSAQKQLKKSLASLLTDRPIFSGKVIQFTNLSAALLEKCIEGAEIEDLGLVGICEELEVSIGRGSSRFVIQSNTGRLLSSAGERQVAFLPGTRFLIVSRKPWQNPKFPNSPPGFTFELVEVAQANIKDTA